MHAPQPRSANVSAVGQSSRRPDPEVVMDDGILVTADQFGPLRGQLPVEVNRFLHVLEVPGHRLGQVHRRELEASNWLVKVCAAFLKTSADLSVACRACPAAAV